MLRWLTGFMLLAFALTAAACGQTESKTAVAEPLMKFEGSKVVYSDQEINCH